VKVYEMDDEPTIYAAHDWQEAVALYVKESGAQVEDGWPCELNDAELDKPRPEYDENEQPTGETTTIRIWLEEATEPGYLCGAMR
jgi:hypothetical protein